MDWSTVGIPITYIWVLSFMTAPRNTYWSCTPLERAGGNTWRWWSHACYFWKGSIRPWQLLLRRSCLSWEDSILTPKPILTSPDNSHVSRDLTMLPGQMPLSPTLTQKFLTPHLGVDDTSVYLKLAGHSKWPFRRLGLLPILNYNFCHKSSAFLAGKHHLLPWVRTREISISSFPHIFFSKSL